METKGLSFVRFAGKQGPFKKMFIVSVGRCGPKYIVYGKLAHLDFINRKVIELIFKLNIPCDRVFKLRRKRAVTLLPSNGSHHVR